MGELGRKVAERVFTRAATYLSVTISKMANSDELYGNIRKVEETLRIAEGDGMRCGGIAEPCIVS
jgi:hypothetical protein